MLVDITPYSFGISFLGERGGLPYSYCYKPIIRRNTPLPVTRTERYFTSSPFQEVAEINIFQGDDTDALRNILVGNFYVDDLVPTVDYNEILCRMRLDLDGILHVSAIEKKTDNAKHITIENALQPMSPEGIAEARKRLESLYAGRIEDLSAMPGPEWGQEEQGEDDGAAVSLFVRPGGGAQQDEGEEHAAGEPDQTRTEAEALLARSREHLERMHPEDREDAIDLNERVADALEADAREELKAAIRDLRELLFFIGSEAK